MPADTRDAKIQVVGLQRNNESLGNWRGIACRDITIIWHNLGDIFAP